MEIELVVTDLDGTLWERDHTVHARTRAAMAQLAERGVPLLVATGRRVSSARAPLAAIGLAPPAVVLNGALGLDLDSGERFHRGGFTPDEAATVLEVHQRLGVDPCVYVDHHQRGVWVSATPSTHPGHLASFGADLVTGDLPGAVRTDHVLAFGVLGLEEGLALALGRELSAVSSPHVDRDRNYGGFTVTVAPLRQSKWDGVAAYCHLHGLDPTAVLALGDGPNDAELLENAAISVVPEDAHADARRHADVVVACAADGGWADILDVLDASLSR